MFTALINMLFNTLITAQEPGFPASHLINCREHNERQALVSPAWHVPRLLVALSHFYNNYVSWNYG